MMQAVAAVEVDGGAKLGHLAFNRTQPARFAALIGLTMTVLYAGALTASVSVTPLPVWSMVLFVLCLLLGLGGLVGSLLLRYRHPPR